MKINWQMLLREIIAVYSENNTKLINGQTELLNFITGGLCGTIVLYGKNVCGARLHTDSVLDVE
jgi:hypothetical protein